MADVKIYAKVIEDEAKNQIELLSQQKSFCDQKIRIMPDCHDRKIQSGANKQRMKVYLLTSCENKDVEFLEIKIYKKYKDAYKEMNAQQYNETLKNMDSIVTIKTGTWGAENIFERENSLVSHVWCISEHKVEQRIETKMIYPKVLILILFA